MMKCNFKLYYESVQPVEFVYGMSLSQIATTANNGLIVYHAGEKYPLRSFQINVNSQAMIGETAGLHVGTIDQANYRKVYMDEEEGIKLKIYKFKVYLKNIYPKIISDDEANMLDGELNIGDLSNNYDSIVYINDTEGPWSEFESQNRIMRGETDNNNLSIILLNKNVFRK